MSEPFQELPSTYTTARAVGARHYFTGKSCKNGHVANRLTSNGTCVECVTEAMRARRSRDAYKERERALANERRRINPGPPRDRENAWRSRNHDKIRDAERARYAANIDVERAKAREREAKKRSTGRGKLDSNMSRGVRKSLQSGRKGGRSWESLVGYSVGDLKEHLEKQFTQGMTWANYGEWHIDHRVPLSVHNYETPDDIDFQKAWCLSNLQPMWALNNLSKGAKLEKTFQPSLALALPANDNKQPSEVAA